MSSENPFVDVLIITAVKDELDVVRDLEKDWERRSDSRGYPYFVRSDKTNTNRAFSIALARPIDMGGEFASNVATRLTNELRPKCLAMVGICAGWRGKVFLGDVIVAERMFRYDSGKLRAYQAGDGRVSDVFHDIRTYNLKPLWIQHAQDFDSEWISTVQTQRPLTYEYQKMWLLYSLDAFESGTGDSPLKPEHRKVHCPDWSTVLQQLIKEGLIQFSAIEKTIKLTSEGKTFLDEHRIYNPDGIIAEPNTPKVYVAPMGTGSKVIEDSELFPTIALFERKVLGVEMEASAIGVVAAVENVAHCIIAKAVADYADLQKNDHFRVYAIETSYRFLMAFLKESLALSELSQIEDKADVPSELMHTIHSQVKPILDWSNINQQCHVINLRLVVLYGVMSPEDLESTLSDLQNLWVLECSELIKHFTKQDLTTIEHSDHEHLKQSIALFDKLRLIADRVDQLVKQCGIIEDLQDNFLAIRNDIFEMLRICCELLRSFGLEEQKAINRLSSEIKSISVVKA